MNNFYKNKIFLAPMAGVCDLAFRTVCRRCGADAVVSEMVSSRGLHFQDKKTAQLLKTNTEEAPLIVQIFGNDPDVMAESAKRLENDGIQYLDINMGCPAPKIVKNGDGCALMQSPALAAKITEKVVKSVSVPVSVKFRLGWDENNKNAVLFAKQMEESGAAAVCVHGRTKEQFYSGVADYEMIRQVKDAVKIPVIGNGDVTDYESACRLKKISGCDSIMIGRGALGNPYVFLAAKNEPAPIGFHEKKKIIAQHIDLTEEYKPQNIGLCELRKHIAWYLKGVPGASKYKVQAFAAKTYKELKSLIMQIE